MICKCGCGQATNIPRFTDRRNGSYAGIPKDYIRGHNRRGRIDSKEHRLNNGASRKGKSHHTAEHKEKLKQRWSGSGSPNWRGGTARKKSAYGISQYKEWRTSVFERDDYTCQRCEVRGCSLEAHHVKGYAKYPELRYQIDNGLTVCIPCHIEIDPLRARFVAAGD